MKQSGQSDVVPAAKSGRARYVYDFGEGGRDDRELLGGKGANLSEMVQVLGADRIPAGFTIATSACVEYLADGGIVPPGLGAEMDAAVERLEAHSGQLLGAGDDPLLVSVRSGAPVSMPGMLDTVLNLGLNEQSTRALGAVTGNDRFAWDSFRRFIQMFGNVCCGIPAGEYETLLARSRAAAGVSDDASLGTGELRRLCDEFRALHRNATGEDFPEDPSEQLDRSVKAVFDSWVGERAVAYRRMSGISEDLGTAVNVQRMVFGNKGATSGSGVAFSRDEITGAPAASGDFLFNAQGEDVVAGVRTPLDLSELASRLPRVHAELLDVLVTLERHYGDMQDTEFTVEQERLYMLQTRGAKRPAQAAVRFATDAVAEGFLTREQALLTIDARGLDSLLHPTIAPDAEFSVLVEGIAAAPGSARGRVVFSADEAVEARNAGLDSILVRQFTEAEDVVGFDAAAGVLTAEGGKASHAALVARGMGKPCVCGAAGLVIDASAGVASVGDVVIGRGDEITIDGSSGRVTSDVVELVEPRAGDELLTVLEWADAARRLGVRANADTARDAERACENGADGIGLCRTEHMFLAADRQPLMRAMIMAADSSSRRDALMGLQRMQQEDFEALLVAMDGRPVTIRLLDPPLHEFMPSAESLARELRAAEGGEGPRGRALELRAELERVRAITESNPMLGTRGVRLAILFPEIYEMQVRAIIRAVGAVRGRVGRDPKVELMIPLVAYEGELEFGRTIVDRIAAEEGVPAASLRVGTMIELPRACFVADRIAMHAEFFSFGTNDLTQTALGLSRDDVEGSILGRYFELGILDRSPFETLDVPGVGALVEMGAKRGRQRSPGISLGVCGEHGGDPDSIEFFDRLGVDYVSCSPERLPIARIAAGQAAIRSS